MSATLFDLGQRLHSATLGRPLARATYAPVLLPINPVAVTVTGSVEHVLVRASDGQRSISATGPEAIAALGDLGVGTAEDPRTLVIADRETLAILLELALATDPHSPAALSAAVIGWWSQRVDHPGTGAVLNLTWACAARWILGTPPSAERYLETWTQWLEVRDTGPVGLLQMASLVADGPTLPGLEVCREDDQRSWAVFVDRVNAPASGWSWRSRDSRREAALGLASRCDAAELWESLRLGDPLVATRESFSGTVVSGRITSMPTGSIVQITLDQLACRLREQTLVEGYAGGPGELPPAGASGALVRGVVTGSHVISDDLLVLTIGNAVVRTGQVRVGQRITLRPRSIDPRQQRSGRLELHRRYAAHRSWLSGGPAPVPRRRDIPLDVAIAAAE